MKRHLVRISGLIAFAFGFYLLLSTFSSITGFAIIDTQDVPFASMWGVAFLVVGAFLLSAASGIAVAEREDTKSRLVELIEQDRKGSDDCLVLVDADYIWHAYQQGVDLPENFFGDYQHAMTQSVYRELTQRNNSGTGNSLIPEKKMHYLTRRLHTEVIDYSPREDVKKHIFALWRTVTEPGKRSTLIQQTRFKESGDMDMLAYACERGKNSTVIMSDNSTEIPRIAHLLRQEGVNVRVYGQKEIPLRKAA